MIYKFLLQSPFSQIPIDIHFPLRYIIVNKADKKAIIETKKPIITVIKLLISFIFFSTVSCSCSFKYFFNPFSKIKTTMSIAAKPASKMYFFILFSPQFIDC